MVCDAAVAEKDDYLVDMLVDLGFVSAEQVAHARTEAQSSHVGVVDLMVANKLIRPADVTCAEEGGRAVDIHIR